ncbi:MerR family transcriptional regulator [Bradyrhizobium sp.]|uniref:MerR family transcriptional regulator n=1 Tax=Bradyrhizobium sp. TaxID=376 RepID=UPI003BB04FF6
MRIGILAERTGTTAPTIRFYEEIGRLRPAARAGGQCTYDHEDVRRLAFIRRCRDFGFSIEEIRALLSLIHNRAPAPRRESWRKVISPRCAASLPNFSPRSWRSVL